MYVYLLSIYDEYGSEQVRATTDRLALPALLKRPWHVPGSRGRDPSDASISGLAELLATPDSALSGDWGHGAMPHNLTDGWGSFQLHVVLLEDGS